MRRPSRFKCEREAEATKVDNHVQNTSRFIASSTELTEPERESKFPVSVDDLASPLVQVDGVRRAVHVWGHLDVVGEAAPVGRGGHVSGLEGEGRIVCAESHGHPDTERLSKAEEHVELFPRGFHHHQSGVSVKGEETRCDVLLFRCR